MMVVLATSCSKENVTKPDSRSEGDVLPQLDRETIEFCEKAIEYKFPSTSSGYDFYDNQEFYVIGHLKLAPADISSFKSRYPFIQQNKTEETYIGLSNLNTENQNIPENTLFTSGKMNAHVHWVMYFHEDTGRVWVSVSYKDWNG